MFRKTLTILSLVGLLLSVAAWGVSCVGLSYERVSMTTGATVVSDTLLRLAHGLIIVSQQRIEKLSPEADASPVPVAFSEWQFRTKWLPKYVETRHKWLPTWEVSGEIRQTPLGLDGERWHMVTVPIYLFVVLTGAYPAYLLTPLHRRRKRRKLGLCLACGYDLRGSVGRCPECGEEFS